MNKKKLSNYSIEFGKISTILDPPPPWRANLQFGDVNTNWTKVVNKPKENNVHNGLLGTHRWWMSLLPGGIYTTTKMFGGRYILRSAWNMFRAYSKTSMYLYKKYGFEAFKKFIGTKIFVPVGEGAGAAAYFIASPFIRKWPFLAPIPRWVEIEITTVCNKKCTHCEHTHWGMTQEQRHLSIDEYIHIIDQFNLTWVHTTGEGSSFLNKDFFKIMEENRRRNIPHYFVDHFDDLKEEDMESILRYDISGIYISIDGASPETYNPVRIGCDFNRVVNNIKRFIALKMQKGLMLPELNFRMVVTNDNVHEMPRFIELVKSFGGEKELGLGARVDFVGVLNFDENEQKFVKAVPYDI